MNIDFGPGVDPIYDRCGVEQLRRDHARRLRDFVEKRLEFRPPILYRFFETGRGGLFERELLPVADLRSAETPGRAAHVASRAAVHLGRACAIVPGKGPGEIGEHRMWEARPLDEILAEPESERTLTRTKGQGHE